MLASLDADVIALQEVVGRRARSATARPPSSAPRSAWAGSWRPRAAAAGQLFGNVVLSRLPLRQHVAVRPVVEDAASRAALQRVDIDVHGHVLHVYNVHLGTALGERRMQAPRLAELVADRTAGGPRCVLGDFNEWARGLATESVGAARGRRPDAAPAGAADLSRACFPLFHLDHIYYGRRSRS